MKNFLSKVWATLKRGFQMFIISTWWVWTALIISAVMGWIFGWHHMVWVFFGLVGAVIAYVGLRQIYWWFMGKGDYRFSGGLPGLWRKIFKK